MDMILKLLAKQDDIAFKDKSAPASDDEHEILSAVNSLKTSTKKLDSNK
jgi:hypothetical protein